MKYEVYLTNLTVIKNERHELEVVPLQTHWRFYDSDIDAYIEGARLINEENIPEGMVHVRQVK